MTVRMLLNGVNDGLPLRYIASIEVRSVRRSSHNHLYRLICDHEVGCK